MTLVYKTTMSTVMSIKVMAHVMGNTCVMLIGLGLGWFWKWVIR